MLDWEFLSNNKKANNHVSMKKSKSAPSCNCKKKNDYPINENCLIKNVSNKCSVSPTTTTNQPAYLDLVEGKTSEKQKLTWLILKMVPGYSNMYIATCHNQKVLSN